MKLTHVLFAATLAATSLPGLAQDRDRDREFRGYHMMTQQERDAYHEKMRAAKTYEERERIRAEHHALMQERMKERGMAPGAGMGGGMGPGMGGGMGRGR